MLNMPILKFDKSIKYLESQLTTQKNNKQLILDIITNIGLILNTSSTNDNENLQNVLNTANDFLQNISNNIVTLEHLNLEIYNITKDLNDVMESNSQGSKTKEFYIAAFSNIKNNIMQYTEKFQEVERKLDLDNTDFNNFINENNFKYNFDTVITSDAESSANNYELTSFSINNDNSSVSNNIDTEISFEIQNKYKKAEMNVVNTYYSNIEYIDDSINNTTPIEESSMGLINDAVSSESDLNSENIISEEPISEEVLLEEPVSEEVLSEEPIIESEKDKKINELTTEFKEILTDLYNSDITTLDFSSVLTNYFKEILSPENLADSQSISNEDIEQELLTEIEFSDELIGQEIIENSSLTEPSINEISETSKENTILENEENVSCENSITEPEETIYSENNITEIEENDFEPTINISIDNEKNQENYLSSVYDKLYNNTAIQDSIYSEYDSFSNGFPTFNNETTTFSQVTVTYDYENDDEINNYDEDTILENHEESLIDKINKELLESSKNTQTEKIETTTPIVEDLKNVEEDNLIAEEFENIQESNLLVEDFENIEENNLIIENSIDTPEIQVESDFPIEDSINEELSTSLEDTIDTQILENATLEDLVSSTSSIDNNLDNELNNLLNEELNFENVQNQSSDNIEIPIENSQEFNNIEITDELIEELDDFDKFELNEEPILQEYISEETTDNVSNEVTENKKPDQSPISNNLEVAKNNSNVKKIDSIETLIENIKKAEVKNTFLIISEKNNCIYLPYTISELINYVESYPDAYTSLSNVVEQEFILDFDKFMKHPFKTRFSEAYNLIKNREGKSKLKSLSYSLKIAKIRNLNPAIIAACKSEYELECYLDCLENNNLNSFKFFTTIYDVNPL